MDTHIETVTVSSRGQIVIPEEIRRELKLKKGIKLVLIKKGNLITLAKTDYAADAMKDIYKFSEGALADIWAGPEEDVWHKYLKNAG